MVIKDVKEYGFEEILYSMRFPYESFDKSDSRWEYSPWSKKYEFQAGDNDLRLLHNLYKGGAEHRKALRSCTIAMTIEAPLYWWKQFDTYRVGVTKNSSSTMHLIMKRKLTMDDFAHDALSKTSKELLKLTIDWINELVEKDENNKNFREVIQMLPDSFIQMRRVSISYEAALNMIKQRRGHKLQEWREFITYLTTYLPYYEEITGEF